MNLIEDIARVGGGAMPVTELADWAVEINPLNITVTELASRLRDFNPAVAARVQNEKLLVNLRAVFEREDERLAQILIAALQEG